MPIRWQMPTVPRKTVRESLLLCVDAMHDWLLGTTSLQLIGMKA